jgi:hypothetical protein
VGRFLSAAQFWQVMERWAIPVTDALDLIAFVGKIGKSGKRPRFRFSPHQKRLTTYLAEIDSALIAAGEDPAWLGRKNRAFKGQTPLDVMIKRGEEGMADVLRFLNRSVLRMALKS